MIGGKGDYCKAVYHCGHFPFCARLLLPAAMHIAWRGDRNDPQYGDVKSSNLEIEGRSDVVRHYAELGGVRS